MKSVAGAVVLATGLVLSGCTQLTGGTPKAGFEPLGATSSGSGAPGYKAQTCEQLHSDAWIEVPGTGPDEPRVRIAQPPGWEPAPQFAKGPVKLLLRNVSLSDGVTKPALSVSIADATDGNRSPEDLLSETIKAFQSIGAQNIDQVPSEICGFPALLVNYTTPPDAQISKTAYVTSVSVMVPLGEKVWNIVVLVQSTAPNNPTFMADAQVMLAGIRIAIPR